MIYFFQITQTSTSSWWPFHPSSTQEIQTEISFYDHSNCRGFSAELVSIRHCQPHCSHQRTSRAYRRRGRNSGADGQSLCYLQPHCLHDNERKVSSHTLGDFKWKQGGRGTRRVKKRNRQPWTSRNNGAINEYVKERKNMRHTAYHKLSSVRQENIFRYYVT